MNHPVTVVTVLRVGFYVVALGFGGSGLLATLDAFDSRQHGVHRETAKSAAAFAFVMMFTFGAFARFLLRS